MHRFLTLDTALGVLLFAVLLLGCASNQAPANGPVNIVPKATCIPIRTWSASEQDKLADAIGSLPPKSIIWTLEKDWQAMRDAARACGR